MSGESLPIFSESAGRTQAPSKRHVLGMDRVALEAWFSELGQKSYRAEQMLDWVFRKGAASFAEMTNLPAALRETLAQAGDVYRSTIVRESVAPDGTTKLLLAQPDAQTVETVWIPAEDRHTACISSQVGCPVGCRFCASGLDGVERNLTAGEIVEQAMRIAGLISACGVAGETRHQSATGGRLSNLVFMGMGEPLANYANVVAAIRILNAEWGMGIGARKITVSTVGLPAQIKRLADEGMQVNLALSLHAPDDRLRHELIPWGKGVPIADLMDACGYYFQQTGREVTFEYVLLAGVNDHAAHAAGLARLAREVRANVNLLRYNPVEGLPYERPSSESAFEFQSLLRARGVNVHLRTSRGLGADAACGQLRRRAM